MRQSHAQACRYYRGPFDYARARELYDDVSFLLVTSEWDEDTAEVFDRVFGETDVHCE